MFERSISETSCFVIDQSADSVYEERTAFGAVLFSVRSIDPTTNE
jgi:hypothetical protein